MHTLMHRTMPGQTALLMASVFLLGAAHADEAVLPNGRRVQGELTSDGPGRLLFQSPGQQTPLPLSQLHHVCFPAASVAAAERRCSVPRRVA